VRQVDLDFLYDADFLSKLFLQAYSPQSWMLRYPAVYGTLWQVTIVAGFFSIHFLFLLTVSFVYCRHHGH